MRDGTASYNQRAIPNDARSNWQKTGPAVLIELRGWVGYQCPLCTKQVHDFVAQADKFRKAGAHVVLIYPGPADKLKEHAEDFISGKGLPDDFAFVIDPDLKFVDGWHLRWEKAGENDFPATYIVDKGGVIRFAKVSHTHGDRATAAQVLDALSALQ